MAKYKSITAPQYLPVSVALTKQHLKVLHTEEDDLIEFYIKAATSEIEKKFRVALNKQVWELYMDEFASMVVIGSHNPLLTINSIKYFDENGSLQTLAESNYSTDVIDIPGVIYIHGTFPTLQENKPNAVIIQFTAGFSTSDVEIEQQDTIPTELREAVFLRVAAFDQYREDKQMDKGKIKASDALCSPYKPTLL